MIDVTGLLIGQLVLRDLTAHTAPAKMANLSKPSAPMKVVQFIDKEDFTKAGRGLLCIERADGIYGFGQAENFSIVPA